MSNFEDEFLLRMEECKGRTFSLLLLTILIAEFINLRLNYFSIRVLSQLYEFLIPSIQQVSFDKVPWILGQFQLQV